jgi:hypothetical protein
MSELDKLGIKVERVHQTSSTSVQGVELGSNETTKLTLTLPTPVKIKATFTPESVGKKVIKLFKKEVQTGDAHFDSEIYISTDTPEETMAFLDEDVRNAIGFIVTNGGPLEIHDTTLSIIVAGNEQGETNEILTIARALVATVAS